MVDDLIPSRDPSNDDSLTGALNEILRKFLQNRVDDMLPARVVAYDRATNRAQVQPLIQILDTEGQLTSRAAVASIPVLFLGGGDFFLSFNLPAGSLGWIKSSDRDISLFLQFYGETGPNTKRLHRFEDAVFIPDIMTGHTIDSEDDTSMVIQNKDASVKISLNGTRIKMTVGGATFTHIDGTFTIDGANLQVNGDINATGTITGDNDVVTGSISLKDHTHDGSPTAPTGPVSDTGKPK